MRYLLPLFAALLALSTLAPNKTTADNPAANEEGFIPLFNGQDLTGWIYGSAGRGKAGAGYQVHDGILYCTAKDGGNLYTEKQYDNFILRFDFKLEPNSNNGVGIRTPAQGDAAYVGMEIQVLDDNGPQYEDKLQPWQYHGSIYNVVPARRGHLNPTGQWNTQEITANGPRITVKLNGHTIVNANLDDVKDPETLKKHPGLNNKTGHIGFLGHGTRVEFRNIRIKEL